jgi:hypothetical protein
MKSEGPVIASGLSEDGRPPKSGAKSGKMVKGARSAEREDFTGFASLFRQGAYPA